MKVNHNAPPTPQSLEQAKQADKTAAAKAATNGGKEVDKTATSASAALREGVEISDSARLMQRAEDVARSAPDVRADRVATLKQSIKDGSYQVDNGSLADRIIEEHLFSGFGKNNL